MKGGKSDQTGQVWLGIKKTCLDIGLSEGQAQRQVANIQKDLILKSNCCKFAMVQNEGNREVTRKIIAIKEEFVTLWLAKIELTESMQRKNPKAVEKLVRYQLEAQKVLHTAFMGTEEQKQSFYSDLRKVIQCIRW